MKLPDEFESWWEEEAKFLYCSHGAEEHLEKSFAQSAFEAGYRQGFEEGLAEGSIEESRKNWTGLLF